MLHGRLLDWPSASGILRPSGVRVEDGGNRISRAATMSPAQAVNASAKESGQAQRAQRLLMDITMRPG